MRKIAFISLLIAMFHARESSSQIVAFADTNFLKILILKGIDSNNDGKIQNTEAAVVKNLTISNANLSNLSGIEAFINLDSLDCSFNQLNTLDLSHNLNLTKLYCSINKLTELNISSDPKLQALSCSNNKLVSLNLINNTKIKILDCGFNKLTALDISADTSLEILECYSNQLENLNLSNNSHLLAMYCGNNHLSSLDFSNNVQLKILDCQFNQLNNLNLSKNIGLTVLACFSNLLTNLDVTKNIYLSSLDCGMNLYTNLDLSKNDSLSIADCTQNPNLKYICVKDTALVNLNPNFIKDASASWTENCDQTFLPIANPNDPLVQINPNPAMDEFRLVTQQPVNIHIFNSTGMEMETFTDLQNLQFGQSYPTGLYFVWILDAKNKKCTVIKIIKN